jgi:hypothetical protein
MRFGTDKPAELAGARARLTLRDGPLEFGWMHCGMTAEFLGNFLAGLAARKSLDANDVRHSVGYLANELIENAVKFRAPGAGDIVIEAGLRDSLFELVLANFATEDTTVRFQALLEEIVSRDPGELLIERIEANASDGSASGSGLGILTLMNDYGVRLGWTFEQKARGEPVRVEVYAALALSNQA